MFWDSTIVLIIPALILTMYAQYRVKATYAKYSKIASRSGLRGVDVAERILSDADVTVTHIAPIPGHLTDHYDPRKRALGLSEDVYYGESIAALGVAAHETGHAIQHARSYAPMALRSLVYPLANLGTSFGYILFIMGIFLSWNPALINLGILLFSAAVFFTFVTLPIEFNASSRALKALASGGYLAEDEIKGARAVLNAAALTYVAAAAMAALQLLRMILISRRR